MNGLPIEAALSHARSSSPFNGDGSVMHVLADEIERMRHWMSRRALDIQGSNPTALVELDLYEAARHALATNTIPEPGREFWPEHLR